MRLSDFLDFDGIRTNVGVRNSKRQLMQLLGQLAGQRLGRDSNEVTEALLEREALGSTGFGGGVAIPHGKLEGLTKVYGMIVHLAEPIDYKAIDGQRVDLAFLLLSPPDAGAEHLKALASISRLARDADLLQKIRGARSRDALAAMLLASDELHAA